MKSSASPAFEIIVEPTSGWPRLPWRDVWQYRDLLTLLVRRDFVAKYKQTVLGPAWFILQPLLTTLVLTVVFGKVAQIGTDGIPATLFYLCNMLGWNYLAQSVGTSASTFATNAHLFGKVYFPRLIVPLSVIVSNLLAFALSLLTFAAFLAYYKAFVPAAASLSPGWPVLWLPLLVVHTAALALGVSLVLSALTVKYRDLVHVTPLLIQLWMFATVVIPASGVHSGWRWMVWANPAYPIVEAFRIILLGKGIFITAQYAASVAFTLASLFLGITFFQRVERTAADTI